MKSAFTLISIFLAAASAVPITHNFRSFDSFSQFFGSNAGFDSTSTTPSIQDSPRFPDSSIPSPSTSSSATAVGTGGPGGDGGNASAQGVSAQAGIGGDGDGGGVGGAGAFIGSLGSGAAGNVVADNGGTAVLAGIFANVANAGPGGNGGNGDASASAMA
ncbi:hypothetical protein FGB62_18g412 [Gracilaria domingensis]|nr:hypothetical protein FGB62_18g412 [Gracilaria domingensis]